MPSRGAAAGGSEPSQCPRVKQSPLILRVAGGGKMTGAEAARVNQPEGPRRSCRAGRAACPCLLAARGLRQLQQPPLLPLPQQQRDAGGGHLQRGEELRGGTTLAVKSCPSWVNRDGRLLKAELEEGSGGP